MEDSKLTSKYQATIPHKVRSTLHLKAGDRIVFEIMEGNRVEIKKFEPLDRDYYKSIEATLSEWSSKMDDEAYRDL